MKILLVGGYSGGNPGDEAILKATVSRLDRLFPHAEFLVWADDPAFSIQFDRGVRHQVFCWNPLAWLKGKSFSARLLTKLYIDFFPFSKRLALALSLRNKRVREALAGFDKAILVGGGYLNSDYNLPEMNLIASAAVANGKPLYLLGQTLGPFRKPHHAQMAREIFEAADKIVLRETHSTQEVASFGAKVLHGIDDAVAFEPRLAASERGAVDRYFSEGEGVVHLGVNLRDWDGSRNYYARIAEAIEIFVTSLEGGRVRVLFVPMETSGHCDDRDEGRELARHLSPALDYEVVTEKLSVEQTYYLISRLDLFAGMRLHSLVFALSAGVPTVGFYQNEYYLRKIHGLFQKFGFEDRVLPLDELADLASLLARTFAEREDLRRSLISRKKEMLETHQALIEGVLNGAAPEKAPR